MAARVRRAAVGYRRRARLGVKYVPGKDRVLVGFRERAAPYITDMARCPVLAPPLDGLLGPLAELIAGTSVRERLPQIEAAVGDDASALVLRVLDAPSAADIEAFAAFGARHDVDMYLQPGGPGTVAPIGRARPLRYSLAKLGVTLEFLPTDFVQVNARGERGAGRNCARARRGAADRFACSISIAASATSVCRSRSVLASCSGVEGDAGLVARAVRNAAANGVENARFVTADLAQPEWSFFRSPSDVVVLDPPRTGAEAASAAMDRIAPRRIVYVSCHPATLARDAQVLVERHGFSLRAVRVFDMFPHTHHVEALALFERG